jgi:hypothetical protein
MLLANLLPQRTRLPPLLRNEGEGGWGGEVCARTTAPAATRMVAAAAALCAALATTGCGVDTCKSTDLDCFLDDLTIFAPTAGGSAVGLTYLPASSLQPASAAAGAGGAGTLPKITNRPPALNISDPEVLTDTELDWSDPNSCQPAFCFRTCSPGQTAAAGCSSRFACTAALSEGPSGMWEQAIGFIAGSSDAPAFFTLGVTPVTAPDCSQVVSEIKSGSGATPGTEVAISTAIAATSGQSGLVCSAPTSCNECSMTACTNGTTCTYEASDGTSYPCSDCQSCEAAGQQILAHCCTSEPGPGSSSSSSCSSSSSTSSSSTSSSSTGSAGPVP